MKAKMVNIGNTVIFRPTGANPWQKLMYNYRALAVEHSDGNSFFRFEFMGNMVKKIVLEERASITLPVPHTSPVMLSRRSSSFFYTRYVYSNGSVSYSTNYVSPGGWMVDVLKIRFEPLISRKGSFEQKFDIFNDKNGDHFGILLLPHKTTEKTLTIEGSVTQRQKEKIVGLVVCFISDGFRDQHFIRSWSLGVICAFLVFFAILVYLYQIL